MGICCGRGIRGKIGFWDVGKDDGQIGGLEEKLHQKADVKALEDLQCRIKQLEDSAEECHSNEINVMRQVSDIKVELSQNNEKSTKFELNHVAVEGEEAMSRGRRM